jgi:hypothetical protein
MISRMTELPLIVPLTDAMTRHGYAWKFNVPVTVALLVPVLGPCMRDPLT